MNSGRGAEYTESIPRHGKCAAPQPHGAVAAGRCAGSATLLFPAGRRVKIIRLSCLCRRRKLGTVRVFGLHSGGRLRHKGWTWRKS